MLAANVLISNNIPEFSHAKNFTVKFRASTFVVDDRRSCPMFAGNGANVFPFGGDKNRRWFTTLLHWQLEMNKLTIRIDTASSPPENKEACDGTVPP